jgi:hypothetical protein
MSENWVTTGNACWLEMPVNVNAIRVDNIPAFKFFVSSTVQSYVNNYKLQYNRSQEGF